MRQHCLQLVAAVPSHGSGSAFTMWQHCLHTVSPLNPHRAPLSLPGPGRTGGTRVYPPLCGGGWCGVPSKTPTGRPYPSPAQAGPEGLGCIRRCVGVGGVLTPQKPPRGVPIPPRPRQDRRDSGVSAAVWGWVVCRPLITPRGVPIPPRPRQDRRDSGVSAAVWGRTSAAQVSGCRCCKLAHTLTCTLWPVACLESMAVHAVHSGAGNLKFRNTKPSAKYIEKCIALGATDTVAQPGQVQMDNQLCHTAHCRTA